MNFKKWLLEGKKTPKNELEHKYRQDRISKINTSTKDRKQLVNMGLMGAGFSISTTPPGTFKGKYLPEKT